MVSHLLFLCGQGGIKKGGKRELFYLYLRRGKESLHSAYRGGRGERGRGRFPPQSGGEGRFLELGGGEGEGRENYSLPLRWGGRGGGWLYSNCGWREGGREGR